MSDVNPNLFKLCNETWIVNSKANTYNAVIISNGKGFNANCNLSHCRL